MTPRRQRPAGPRRPDTTPQIPGPRPGDKDQAETAEPYDLPFPDDYRPPRRPEYVIVVDQLRGWQPGGGHRLWPCIQSWAAELGLTGPEALAAASRPPDRIHHDHDDEHIGGQFDREAAD